jgi:WD40 repeat protein
MSFGRRSWWFAGLLAVGAVQLVAAQEPKTGTEKGEKAKEPGAGGLPSGAVARLGQTRLRHADRPTCVVFAPDGKTFLTGGEDGTVRTWSVATGDQLQLLQKSGLKVSELRLTHGGKRLAVQFGTDGLIRYFDPETLRETGSTPFLNKHQFGFTTDGALMATTDLVGTVTVTELLNDLPKLELPGADVFHFRPDGKAIAIGDKKGNVAVHLVTGGKPIFSAKLDGAILGVAFSDNGARLAVGLKSATGDDAVRVYEFGKDKEKPVAEIAGVNLPRAWVGTDALAASSGTEAGVYDLAKKAWTGAGRVKGVTGDFAVSPDGTKLAATGTGLRVRLYDLTTGKQLHAENDSFPDPSLLIGSADGKTLFLLTTDTAYLWPVGAASATPAGTLPGQVVTATAAGGTLVVATKNEVITYTGFDPAKPLPAKPAHTFKDSAGARVVAVTADGKRVAWAQKEGTDGVVTEADADGTGARRTVPVGTTVLGMGYNPAGDRLGVLGRDPFLRLWDVKPGAAAKEVWKARVLRGLRGTVAFSADGKLVTAVSSAQLAVYDAADGKDAYDKDAEPRKPRYQFERYTDQGQIQHAAFTPDGRNVVVGSVGAYGRVEVWELATQGLARAFTTGYGGTSRMCLFANGTRIASAGAEEAVTVWDLTYRAGKAAPKAGELLLAWADLESSDAAVGCPATKALAAGGDAGTATIARGTKDILAAEKKIAEWVTDLGSQTFSIREIAIRELVAQGARCVPAVTAALASDDADTRDRAKEVLKKLEDKGVTTPAHGLNADTLRLVRAVQALEEIGTESAKALLQTIAGGGGRAGDEAKAALARLKK